MIAALVHRFFNVRGEKTMCSGKRKNPSTDESMTSRGAMSAKVTVVSCLSHAAHDLAPMSPVPVSTMMGKRGFRNKKFIEVMIFRGGCCGVLKGRAFASGAGIFIDALW